VHNAGCYRATSRATPEKSSRTNDAPLNSVTLLNNLTAVVQRIIDEYCIVRWSAQQHRRVVDLSEVFPVQRRTPHQKGMHQRQKVKLIMSIQ
jgi:hypothetical protein